MIYFSQLQLSPISRMVQRELASPYEMHRTLLKAFGMPRQEAGMLHRVEADDRGVRVLVQSAEKPNWLLLNDVGQGAYLLRQPEGVKSAEFTLPTNATYRFRLRASPTVAKKRYHEDGRRRNSNRVSLVREENQCAWLQKKAVAHGFNVLQSQIEGARRSHDRRRSLTIFSVQFDGLLQITDAEKFNTAWRSGIGSAKAFGCGLLSLAPA